MKKQIVIILLVLLMVCSFAACQGHSVQRELAVCGSYAVPYMPLDDMKGDVYSCEVLETDSYGRYLYTFSAESLLTGERATVLVICQRIDDEYVYYYEDVCYLAEGYSDADIPLLKTANDWNLPMAEKNLAKRSHKMSFDGFLISDAALDYARIRSVCMDARKADGEEIRALYFLDADGKGHELYWLHTGTDESDRMYLVLVDSSYYAAFLEVSEGKLDAAETGSFKRENGWVYK